LNGKKRLDNKSSLCYNKLKKREKKGNKKMTIYKVWYIDIDNDTHLDKVFTNEADALKYVSGQLNWLDPVEEGIYITAEKG
jgi:hypothetical protein